MDLLLYKKKLEEQYRLIVENSPNAVKIIDLEGNIIYASPAHKHIFGYDANEYIGENGFDSVHPDDLSKSRNAFEDFLMNKKVVVLEMRKQHKEGHWIWIEATFTQAIHSDGDIQSIVVVTRDISERKEYEKKLEYMAYHDFLTGLFNRRKFKQMFEISLDEASEKNRKLAVLMMDLNHFKWINDNLGHEAGDNALQEFSRHLMNCKRDGDIIGRLSGDEFAIVMKDISDEKEIVELIDRLTAFLAEPCVFNNNQYQISISIGVSISPDNGHSSSQLMKCADVALYNVKKTGKSNYNFYKKTLALH